MATTPAENTGHCGMMILCLEASKNLHEPLCSPQELQEELVPYVFNYSLQSNAFVGLPKAERQLRLKALTQQILSGEAGAGAGGASESPAFMREADTGEFGPQRFWAYLRSKYGTLGGHIQQTLQHLEPQLANCQVVVLRFEGEPAVPSTSLLVRASLPCGGSAAASKLEESCLRFDTGQFSSSEVSSWLAEASLRAPPLWSRLVDECNRQRGSSQVLLLCTDTESTETGPRSLTLAAHLLKNDCSAPPFISGLHIGPQSSERLAALQDICTWSGGLALSVEQTAELQPSVEGLASYLFGPGIGQGLGERRDFYLKKQSLGTCFLSLPPLGNGSDDWDRVVADMTTTGASIDVTTPSDTLNEVLSDVSLALPRRWSRSLRCWREHRGLRDVVFSEPGGLGLELDEPDLNSADPAKQSWRLRATHPPASSLKIEEHAELVAINTMRVHTGTARGEVAKRVACRPVSLTFRCSACKIDREDLGLVLSMAVAEVVVGELRERCPPIKTKEPPLSTVSERLRLLGTGTGTAAAGVPVWATLRSRGAETILQAVRPRGPGRPEVAVEDPTDGRKVQVPVEVLVRILLLCGSILSLARTGLASRAWRQLLLAPTTLGLKLKTKSGPAEAEAEGVGRELWSWTLRWGDGLAPRRRIGLWLRLLAPSAGAADARVDGQAQSRDLAQGAPLALRAVLARDPSGLLRLSQALAGATPGAAIAARSLRLLTGPEPMPVKLLESLLAPPLDGQRLWLLASSGLPWLVEQCRVFQVAFAAHCPQLFRHFMGEGLAPELFYCSWLQQLLHGCDHEESISRLWDLFIFERSHKILIRAAIAVFKLLETRLRGDIDQIMKVLLSPQTWGFRDDALVHEALSTKVTRSMVQEILAH